MSLTSIKKEIQSQASPEKAKVYQRFFKTGKGEYGEGDVFLGLTVPESREIAKNHQDLTFSEIKTLLESRIHEERLIALLLLVHKYKTSNEKERIVEFYLQNTKNINNWDLVDLSAYQILGTHLQNNDRSVLYKLARSSLLWERRIAIVSTFHFIKNNQFEDTLKISKILLSDKHDLMHKAVGWMLRELGKRDLNALENFLQSNYADLPRTTLRYAIEKFPEEKRKNYLKGNFK